jgi:hypothetical protein
MTFNLAITKPYRYLSQLTLKYIIIDSAMINDRLLLNKILSQK